MIKMKFGIISWTLFVIMTTFNLSQDKVNAKFERISVDQGLHQNIVMALCQDYKGFLWIGTSDGLNRYDGYEFKLYKHDPNKPDSLPDNKIHCIYKDKANNLWIGSDGGLSKYDRMNDSFINYRNKVNEPSSLSNNEVFSILEDSGGILWIGTFAGGLNQFVDGKFNHYRYDPDIPGSLSNNNVWAIYEDIHQRLWVGTDKGLNVLDKNKEKFTCYGNGNTANSISSDTVYAITGDKNGTLWLGTENGFDQLEPGPDSNNIKVSQYKINGNGSPGINGHIRVQCLIIDNTGILWIGTYGSGLKRFDPQKRAITSYLSNPRDFYTISHNYIHTIYQDNSDIMWIGTRGGALNKLKINGRFGLCQEGTAQSGGLNHNMIFAVLEDRRGELWVGTYEHGINRFNKSKTQTTYYKNDPRDPGSLANNNIRAIFEDHKGTLWFGTDKGLDKYDRNSNRFTHYVHDPNNTNSLSNNKVRSRICEDQAGKLWIGTEDGLNKFDPDKKTFTRYMSNRNDPNSAYHLPAPTVMAVIEEIIEGKSFMWIGTYNGGLSMYDRQNKQFTHYRHIPNSQNSLSSNIVRVLHIDKTGTLWIGTDSGLNKFDRNKKQFFNYTEKEGLKNDWLPNNSIYGILEDDDGHLWLSTLNGITKFNPQRSTFKNFDARDGLQGYEFCQGTYFKNREGKLFFGGTNGFNSFYPGAIKDNTSIPPVVITDFRLNNKTVWFDNGHKASLPRPITEMTETDVIKLDYKNNILSFEFAALDFYIPGKNKYGYIMENLDKNWNYVNAGKRFVVYTNMKPGKYVFHVIASNHDGFWNEKGTSIKIYIPPPIWQTWWFLVILIFLGCMMICGGYLWRTRWLREKLAEQERVQKILTQSRDEMEKSRDLAEFRNAENEKLITAISSILVAVDNNGCIFQWNSASEKFFGLKEPQMIGKPLKDYLVNYISFDKLKEILHVGLTRKKASNDIEIPVYFKGHNETRMLLANINPIVDKKGKKFGFLLLAEDITFRKKEEMQRNLSQKLEALGQMAAGIAHEICSPLQYIGDNGRFLLEAFSNLTVYFMEVKNSMQGIEEAKVRLLLEKLNQIITEKDFDFYSNEIPRAAEQIVDGVMRVSNIVKSMNEFAHMGRGTNTDEKSDLNELLKSTLVVAQNRINKVAELETLYTQGLPPIHCGRGELSQVFLNLLSNAVDAIADSGRRGVIKIVTRRQGNESIVEISDNGIGIPDEIKGKMFTPFFTTKSLGQGTGQGLHFSYRIIVERYKGKIYFKSKEKEGTTFYIHLPIGDNELK